MYIPHMASLTSKKERMKYCINLFKPYVNIDESQVKDDTDTMSGTVKGSGSTLSIHTPVVTAQDTTTFSSKCILDLSNLFIFPINLIGIDIASDTLLITTNNEAIK